MARQSFSRPRLLLTVLIAGLLPWSARAATLSFDDRVAAETALERVRYAHQTGATAPFEEAVPKEVMAARVERYLQQSAALAQLWNTPVTGAMLRAEMERQARESRMPERLAELYRALGNDPIRIQECLARPALVDRLARNFFSFDERWQGAARADAEALRAALVRDGIAAFAADSRREDIVVGIAAADAQDSAGDDAAEAIELDASEYERWRSALPKGVGVPGAVQESADRLSVLVVLEEQTGRARVARFAVPKRSWDDWWTATLPALDGAEIRSVAEVAPLPDTNAAANPPFCAPDDTWAPIADLSGLVGRSGHTAVWTGSRMLVWGGHYYSDNFYALNSGGSYDPATDTWRVLATIGAPTARTEHGAVWTGSRMVVWGGWNGFTFPYNRVGGRYDPITDSWIAMSDVQAPAGRREHSMVWTGSRVVVYGGFDGSQPLNTGGRYDPATDTWSPTTTTGASYRRTHSTAWTGSLMVVKGGGPATTTGERYDPAADVWTPVSEVGAPAGGKVVWTGDTLVAWSGSAGGRYDPVTNTWAPMSTAGAPPFSGTVTVAAGNRALFWGAYYNSQYVNTGGLYDPVADTWTPTSTVNAPAGRTSTTGVWTGDRVLIWAGYNGTYLTSGGRYDPASDTWTTMTSANLPGGRSDHIGLWTGNVMIVWGAGGTPGNTGGRYDPATNTWLLTSLVGAPASGSGKTAVWTGSEMIVWPAGARYDPISDSWRSMSSVAAPPGGAAVWTGTHMVIWSGTTRTGGRYDPAADQWLGVSTMDAPSSRSGFPAVWTGNRMVIWGGSCLDTGALYDPVSDTWAAMTTVGAPSGKTAHKAVWTGSRMITWGGSCTPYLNSGGLYDPATDTWSPIAVVGEPQHRTGHTVVWTGTEMIVWGGYAGSGPLATGGRYFPDSNTWAPTSLSGAPAARTSHTAVWTGRRMIVWGGHNTLTYPTGGAQYAVGDFRDADGDAYVVCQGDCNDADAGVNPDASESCNAIDDDCDGATDEDANGVDSDADRIANACDNCPAFFNESQHDSDQDGEGDPCDADDGAIFVYRASRSAIDWQPEAGNQSYNVYVGDLAALRTTGQYTQAPGSNALAARSCHVAATSVPDSAAPLTGQTAFALVTGVAGGVEGSLGTDSEGATRPNANPCP